MIDPGLIDRVVLITGANHGIGAATAQALAAQGARVFIHFLRLPNEDAQRAAGADGVVGAIRAAGGQADSAEADLRDVAAIPLLFDKAEAAFGGVEILINNATYWQADSLIPANAAPDQRPGAHGGGTPTLETTAAIHDAHFAVNSRAVALMMTEFARRHVARRATWGRIINLTTGAPKGFPGEVSYGASKHALESYSYSAAAEYGRFGITVNIVAPGPTQTGWITPDFAPQIIAHTPLGRLGYPDDLADLIVFVASGQARWVTGQLISADGGHGL